MIFLILIVFKVYIKVRYSFWAYQPVCHTYDLFRRLYPRGIINNDLPEINKFCNFYNIVTKDYEETDQNTLKEIIGFLRTHSNTNSKTDATYMPTLPSFSSYFGGVSKSFISIYYKTRILIDTKVLGEGIHVSPSEECVGVITSRHLNITLKDIPSFKIYYIDNLCVHTEDTEHIAHELIQTHEYMQRHKNRKSQISLFKREGREKFAGVVALTTYNKYEFLLRIPKRNLQHASMQIIEITKLNIQLLTRFIYGIKSRFECIVLPDLTNLLNLITNDTYTIYGIIQGDELLACYFFRDKINAIECFASISDIDNEIFIRGFSIALYKYSKKMKTKLITIENISDNNIIINNLFLLNIIPKNIIEISYYLYNYSKKPIIPEKVVII